MKDKPFVGHFLLGSFGGAPSSWKDIKSVLWLT